MPQGGTDSGSTDAAGRRLPAGRVQTSGCVEAGGPGQGPARRPRNPLQRATRRAGATYRLDQQHGRLLAEPVRPVGRLIEENGSMSDTQTRTVVVEREVPFAPEKIWRALTQPHLIAEWLMKNDFHPVVDHRFNFRADWGAVDCQVLAVEPNKTLSYTWGALGLESVVTWTLTPTSTGTQRRMEKSGFRPDQQQAYQGAKGGWKRFFANLEQVLGRID